MFREWTWLLTLGIMASWLGSDTVLKAGLAEALRCEGHGDCKCTFDDHSGTIDLSTLGNINGTARFADVKGRDGFLYSFNPCKQFNEGDCLGVAVCRISADKSTYTNIGAANTASWTPAQNGTNATLMFQIESTGAEPTIRQSFVSLSCDLNATTPTFEAYGQDGPDSFFFTLISKCACVNGCQARRADGGGGITLSVGSIVLITAFVCLLVYLTGGVAYKRTEQDARGVEQIPHIEFWRSVPGFVRDGFLFVTCRFSRPKDTYASVD